MNFSSRFLGAACAATLSLAALPAFGQTSSSTTVTNPATGTSTTTTTTSMGTISDFSPDVITVRASEGVAPVRYSYTKTTEYVDDAGVPVSMSVVKSGLPVTVYYAKEGDRMVARRVVVRRTTTTAPVVAPVAPVVEKETTTTTTTTGGK